MFSAGVAVGVAASWNYLKKKHEYLIQKEKDEIKEAFSKKDKHEEPDVDPEAEKKKYISLVDEYGAEFDEEDVASFIRIIPPEELGNIEDYDTTSFYYTSDGILIDLHNVIVDDPEEIVGCGFEEHFGEYEDNSVCIRNYKLKCDYEILLEERTYYEITKATPPNKEE